MTLSGCKNAQNEDTIDALDFPVEEMRKWSFITTDDIIPRPCGFNICDSSIFLLGYMNGYWLHEFNKIFPTEPVSTIRKGQGPAELINAVGMTLSDDGNQKTIFDFTPKQFKTYDKYTNVINQVNLKSLKVNIHDAWPLMDNQCLILSVVPQAQNERDSPLRTYLLADLDSMSIIARYDSIDKSRIRYLPNLIAPSVYVLSPDGKHIASGTMYGGILESFSISENAIEESFFKVLFPYEMPKNNRPIEKPLYGFSALCATNELVYAAFWGTTDTSKPTDIGVWKWNGEPVRLIRTDAAVIALDIDEKTNTLYAVTFNQETGSQLVKMKL